MFGETWESSDGLDHGRWYYVLSQTCVGKDNSHASLHYESVLCGKRQITSQFTLWVRINNIHNKLTHIQKHSGTEQMSNLYFQMVKNQASRSIWHSALISHLSLLPDIWFSTSAQTVSRTYLIMSNETNTLTNRERTSTLLFSKSLPFISLLQVCHITHSLPSILAFGHNIHSRHMYIQTYLKLNQQHLTWYPCILFRWEHHFQTHFNKTRNSEVQRLHQWFCKCLLLHVLFSIEGTYWHLDRALWFANGIFRVSLFPPSISCMAAWGCCNV